MSTSYLCTAVKAPFQRIDFDLPEPAPGEALVRLTRCTICRSDLHTYFGRRSAEFPLIVGHEIAGRIEAFGADTPRIDSNGTPLTIGCRVAWSTMASCGVCFYCLRSLPQKCESLFKYGHERTESHRPIGGGTATHLLLRPGTPVHRLPECLPDELAAIANCAGATVAAVVRNAGELKDRIVLVLGAGVLGLIACAMAKRAGATVFAVDPIDDNRERAVRFGATATCHPNEANELLRKYAGGHGADAVLELAGPKESVELALKSARIGGTVVLAGSVNPVSSISIEPEWIVRRCLTIRGVHNYGPPDLGLALEFLNTGSAPFGELLGPSFPLHDVDAAFAYAESHPGRRVVLDCEG